MPEPSAKSTFSASSHIKNCTVQLLDDVSIQIIFKKTDMGSAVFDHVCDQLNLIEKDYFGLRFMDQNLHRYWLDPAKPILKQVKGNESIVFAFRVKFYPADPSILKEEFTRYLLVLQLRRDLLHGRLHCPQNDLANLAAYIVQGELGDYDADEHTGNYVSQFKLLLNQTPKIEEKIGNAHKNLKGQLPADTDLHFLKKSASLDTYGYYPYTIKDSKAGQVYLGATPKGILVYQTSRKLHHLTWADIDGMDYSGREFLIFPKKSYIEEHQFEPEGKVIDLSILNNGTTTAPDPAPKRPASVISDAKSFMSESSKLSRKRPSIKFVCPNSSYCKQLWKYMLSEQAFFTCQRSTTIKPVVKRSLLFRHSTFRWHPSNRVLEELKEVEAPHRDAPLAFERSHVPRQVSRDERTEPWANKFHTLPGRSKNSAALDEYARATSAEAVSELTNSLQRPSILMPRDESGLSAITSPIQTTSQASPAMSQGAVSATNDTSTSSNGRTIYNNAATPGVVDRPSPIATSTPITETMRSDITCTPLSSKSSPQPVNTSSAFSKKANGFAYSENDNNYGDDKSVKNGNGMMGKFWRGAFLALLCAIALCGVVVCAMESDRLRPSIDAYALTHDFRHLVYGPARRFVMQLAAPN